MKNFQTNIVPAYGQNPNNVYLFDNKNAKVRILFVGNSITKHSPRPEIGWNNDCGMAASSVEKDYVHLTVKKIAEKYDESLAFGIAQVAEFERNFSDMKLDEVYHDLKDFKPNIVIMFFGANVSKEYDKTENPVKKFGDAYEDLRNYINFDNSTEFFHSDGFYIRPVLDKEKFEVAEKYNDVYINLKDIREREDTHGKFNHPGDVGMAAIAERFFENIEPALKKITNK